MKINKTDKILQVYNSMEGHKIKSNKNSLGKDEINLSERAMDYQIGMKKLKQVPDMRIDKVEKIKTEIKTGTYNVKGKEIAEKIFENIKLDRRI